MIQVRSLLSHLARPEVTEVAVVSGKPPCACIAGVFKPIDRAGLTTDQILQVLISAGGSRHVDELGPTATQWFVQAEGIGTVTVAALMQGSTVQARFSLKRDAHDQRASVPPDGLPASQPRGQPQLPSVAPQQQVPSIAPMLTKTPTLRVADGDSSNPVGAFDGRRGPESFARYSMPALKVDLAESMRPQVTKSVVPDRDEVNSFARNSSLPALQVELEERRPKARGQLFTPATGPVEDAIPMDVTIDRPPPSSRRAAHLAEAISLPPPAPSDPSAFGHSNLPPARALAAPPPMRAFAPEALRPPPSSSQRSPPAPPPRPPPVSAPISLAPSAAPVSAPIAEATLRPFILEEPSSGRPTSPSPQVSSVGMRREGRSTNPVATRTWKQLLLDARTSGTSDLHIIAGRPALMRLAGELREHGDPLDAELVEQMLFPRVPARLLPVLERDGSCDFSLQEMGLGRFRVNVSRHRDGLKASMRLVPEDIPTLASLGLPEAIGSATRHHQGLIVLTGPTGHGKTTTLAAIVDILNTETAHHIITVEDPVEFIHPRKKAMISQREVGTHTKTFHAALKASLREDPDVLVVGELRDTETMRMALAASETGHLVIGTMNTPSAAKTIDRIIDLFPPGDQQQVRTTLAGGLRMIVSQRLLPNPEGTGVVAAVEILPGLPALWNLIRDSKTFQIPSLQQRGRGLGIVRLDDSLAELVRTGKTTHAAALVMAESPDELEAVLAGRRVPAAPVSDSGKGPASDNAVKDLFGKAGSLFKRKGP